MKISTMRSLEQKRQNFYLILSLLLWLGGSYTKVSAAQQLEAKEMEENEKQLTVVTYTTLAEKIRENQYDGITLISTSKRNKEGDVIISRTIRGVKNFASSNIHEFIEDEYNKKIAALKLVHDDFKVEITGDKVCTVDFRVENKAGCGYHFGVQFVFFREEGCKKGSIEGSKTVSAFAIGAQDDKSFKEVFSLDIKPELKIRSVKLKFEGVQAVQETQPVQPSSTGGCTIL